MSSGGHPEGTAPQLTPEEQASVDLARNGLPDVTPAAPAPEGTPSVPEGIPAKFVKDGVVDYAALAASYTELESKLGAPKDEGQGDEGAADGDPKVAPGGKIEKAAKEETPAENPLASLLDLARNDYTSSQAFSDETVTKLAEAGIPAEVQQVYLAGLEALATKQTETVQGFVGGEANYAAMSKWAAQALSDAELDAFNGALDNPALTENAVRGLYARYTTARPSEGRLTAPVNGAPGAGDTYQSKDEFVAALQNPLYQSDPGYRRSVEEKLQRSRAAGFRVNG